VRAVIDKVDFPQIDNSDLPRKETWLLWNCVRCNKQHQWLVPPGRSLEDTARQSLTNSVAYRKSIGRDDVYQKLRGASPEIQKKILFGELIWLWRQEAPREITQAMAAEAAGISPRQWIRIEAGESLPYQNNLVGVVHAVDGIMDQAYLLTDSDKIWNHEMERRLAEEEARISRDEIIQKAPDDEVPEEEWVSPDVKVSFRALKKVLAYEPDADNFLFYAYAVHQEYWGRGSGGTITIDDNRTKIIPLLKKLFNIIQSSEDKRTPYLVVYLMAKGAKFFMTKTRTINLVIYFIRRSFTSAIGQDKTSSRMGSEWKKLSPIERLALILFDLIDPQSQPRYITACQKFQGSSKGIDHWLQE
jgi:hypothetical protein